MTYLHQNLYTVAMLKHSTDTPGCIKHQNQFGLVAYEEAMRCVLINKVTLHWGRVSAWTSDCLQAGKPSWYVTNCQGQLSLLSL